jgi:peptidoglycan/LPS O-acetylase OafA/YrhL
VNSSTSTYLDAARFLAALAVFVGHTELIWAPGLIPFAAHIGSPAVGIFFVLSGFVIGYAVDRKERDAYSYFLNRAARVYSVVVPTLSVTMVLDLGGRWLAPEVYAPLNLGSWSEAAKLLLSLTFVNQAWSLNVTPGSNGPFWSLACEIPYYFVFGLWYFGRTLRWRLLAVAAMVAVGPTIALLFCLWLLGLCCYHLSQEITLTRTQGRALLAGSVMAWTLFAFWTIPYYAQFFAAGIPFAASIIGFSFSDISLNALSRPVRWIAGATFTLYLLHYPLGVLLQATMPSTWPLALRWVAIVGIVIPSTFLLAQFTERRKEHWRRSLARILSHRSNKRMPLASSAQPSG